MKNYFLLLSLFFMSSAFASGIRGHIDSVTARSDGSVRISGWACDRGVNTSINVHIYLSTSSSSSGSLYKGIRADLSSSDSATISGICQTSGVYHRYRWDMPPADVATHHGKTVVVFGISANHPNDRLTNSGNFTVPDPVTPSAPSGVTSSMQGTNIRVVWGSVTGASTYRVRQRINGVWQTAGASISTTNAEFPTSPDTAYQFQVQACNLINKCSSWSTATTAISTPAVPAQPARPQADFSKGSITITWPSVSGATSYRIRQRLNGTWQGSKNTGSARSYEYSTTPGDQYQYQVRACNSLNQCSSWSSASTAITTPAGITGHIDSVSMQSNGSVRIHGWACDRGVNTSINVHIYLNAAAPNGLLYKSVKADRASSESVADVCGTTGTSHRFLWDMPAADVAVHHGKKVYVHGISAQHPNALISNSGSFSIPAPLVPAVPGGLKADLVGIKIDLSWNSVSGASSYKVRQRINGTWQSASAPLTSRTLQITPQFGSSYQFQVQSCGVSGQCSNWSSATATISVPVAIPFEVSYQYDALGRLIETSETGAAEISYEYDDAGNRKAKSTRLD